MRTMNPPISNAVGNVPKAQRLPGLLTGIGGIVAIEMILLKLRPPTGSFTHLAGMALMLACLVWMVLALCLKQGRALAFIRLLSINAAVMILVVLIVEGAGRISGFDFSRLAGRGHSREEVRDQYPIFAREPDRPLPEVFFQHPGPAAWTGKPLQTMERLRLGTDNAYADEPTITVSYDDDGFRNPPDLRDWDLAVVGDSYTELGYMPADDITTTQLARKLGRRVKNLGTCNTGLLAYARYLRAFGSAPSMKQVVFVMFEGNDVQDTTEEYTALQTFQAGGGRPFRDSGPEHSFVKSVGDLVAQLRHRATPQSYQNAWFKHGTTSLPVTISVELPVNPRAFTVEQREALEAGVSACASEARLLGLVPMLAYIPVNNRVYHGMLDFDSKLPAEVREWEPHELPEIVSALCRENGMLFVDTTPALRAAASQGHYVHNRILDCHVNAAGAAIIATAIAQAIEASVKPAQVANH